MGKRVQYALIYSDGSAVERTHQDDESDPIVGSTLEALVDAGADHVDTDRYHFFQEFEEGGELDGCKIVREEITVLDLNPDELAVLAKLKKDADNDADDAAYEDEDDDFEQDVDDVGLAD